jgi:hypothetical protein
MRTNTKEKSITWFHRVKQWKKRRNTKPPTDTDRRETLPHGPFVKTIVPFFYNTYNQGDVFENV